MKTSTKSRSDRNNSRSNRTTILSLVILGVAFTIGTIQPPSFSDEDGEEVFQRVCSTCHAVAPPSEMMQEMKAPPMQMIKMHYFRQLESEKDVRTALNVWLLQPDSSRSLLPTHAIAKHGVMPPLDLSDEERVAVVDYILQLETPVKGMMMEGKECSAKDEGGECKMMHKSGMHKDKMHGGG